MFGDTSTIVLFIIRTEIKFMYVYMYVCMFSPLLAVFLLGGAFVWFLLVCVFSFTIRSISLSQKVVQ